MSWDPYKSTTYIQYFSLCDLEVRILHIEVIENPRHEAKASLTGWTC